MTKIPPQFWPARSMNLVVREVDAATSWTDGATSNEKDFADKGHKKKVLLKGPHQSEVC